jgi:hypothetical protein
LLRTALLELRPSDLGLGRSRSKNGRRWRHAESASAGAPTARHEAFEIDLWRTSIVTPGTDQFLSLAEGLFADAALGPELRYGTFRTKEMLARQLASDPDTALVRSLR